VPFAIKPSAELPIDRPVMREIVEGIVGGRLKPDEKLPSHRDLAEQLVIAPLTVKKAYDELEALGFIESQRGRGTFVAAVLPAVDRVDRLDRIRQAARTLLSEAYLAGLGFPEILKLLKEADRHLAHGPRVEKEKKSA
jgi:GntR family transcriptional regulator